MLRVETKTWTRDSHDLFDYEAQQVNKKSFLISTAIKLFRSKAQVSCVADNPQCLPNTGQDYLLSVRPEEDRYIITPAEHSLINQYNIKKLWIIVKDLPEKYYTLHENDIIKLGRFRLKVRQFIESVDTLNSLKLDDNPSKKCETVLDSSNIQCRICLIEGNQEKDPLICPCDCKGSIKYAHLFCLRKWINGRLNLNDQLFTGSIFIKDISCELCKTKYPKSIKQNDELVQLVKIPNLKTPLIVLDNIIGQTNKGVHLISFADKKYLKLGRGHESDVRIPDVSISRYHASIKYDKGLFKLEDHNSKFGTLVALRKAREIFPNDTMSLQVGRSVVNFKVDDAIPFQNGIIDIIENKEIIDSSEPTNNEKSNSNSIQRNNTNLEENNRNNYERNQYIDLTNTSNSLQNFYSSYRVDNLMSLLNYQNEYRISGIRNCYNIIENRNSNSNIPQPNYYIDNANNIENNQENNSDHVNEQVNNENDLEENSNINNEVSNDHNEIDNNIGNNNDDSNNNDGNHIDNNDGNNNQDNNNQDNNNQDNNNDDNNNDDNNMNDNNTHNNRSNRNNRNNDGDNNNSNNSSNSKDANNNSRNNSTSSDHTNNNDASNNSNNYNNGKEKNNKFSNSSYHSNNYHTRNSHKKNNGDNKNHNRYYRTRNNQSSYTYFNNHNENTAIRINKNENKIKSNSDSINNNNDTNSNNGVNVNNGIITRDNAYINNLINSGSISNNDNNKNDNNNKKYNYNNNYTKSKKSKNSSTNVSGSDNKTIKEAYGQKNIEDKNFLHNNSETPQLSNLFCQKNDHINSNFLCYCNTNSEKTFDSFNHKSYQNNLNESVHQQSCYPIYKNNEVPNNCLYKKKNSHDNYLNENNLIRKRSKRNFFSKNVETNTDNINEGDYMNKDNCCNSFMENFLNFSNMNDFSLQYNTLFKIEHNKNLNFNDQEQINNAT